MFSGTKNNLCWCSDIENWLGSIQFERKSNPATGKVQNSTYFWDLNRFFLGVIDIITNRNKMSCFSKFFKIHKSFDLPVMNSVPGLITKVILTYLIYRWVFFFFVHCFTLYIYVHRSWNHHCRWYDAFHRLS